MESTEQNVKFGYILEQKLVEKSKWCTNRSVCNVKTRYIPSSRLSLQSVLFRILFDWLPNVRTEHFLKIFWKVSFFWAVWNLDITMNVTKEVSTANTGERELLQIKGRLRRKADQTKVLISRFSRRFCFRSQFHISKMELIFSRKSDQRK